MRSNLWRPAALLLLILAFVAVPLAMWYFERPWVEVVGESVLRTSATAGVVAEATHAVVEKHQNFIPVGEGSNNDPTFASSSRTWTSGPSPADARSEVSRSSTSITDAAGHRLSIERVTSSGAATLVFIEFDRLAGAKSIVSELVAELESRGVDIR